MGVISDIYEGNGAKPVSWEEIGQTLEGEIVQIRSKQLPKFGTDIPDTWDDGSPKFTPIVTLQLEGGLEDEEDDGRRDIYLRSNAFTAFGKALREAYKSKPDDGVIIGARLKIQFYATEKSGKGQPRKLFRARITPKAVSAGAATDAWDTDTESARLAKTGPVNASRPVAQRQPSASQPAPPVQVPDEDIPF